MSSIITGIRSLFTKSSKNDSPASGDEIRPFEEPDERLLLERLREHEDLVEIYSHVPTRNRVGITVEEVDSPLSAVMPRGLNNFLLRMQPKQQGERKVSWKSSQGEKKSVTFLSTKSMSLRGEFGTDIILRWIKPDLRFVRVRCIYWGESAAGDSISSSEVIEVDSSLESFTVPLNWLGCVPTELRVTPFEGERQGFTECLLLPAREDRVEVLFERILVPIKERLWKRLKLSIRVPNGVSAPQKICLKWEPFDTQIEGAEWTVPWANGQVAIEIPLHKVSARGDQVTVSLAFGDEAGAKVGWFARERYEVDQQEPEVLLRDDVASSNQTFCYEHRFLFPDGNHANILVGDKPLIGHPEIYSGEVESRIWPQLLKFLAHQATLSQPSWSESIRIRGSRRDALGDLEAVPQQYVLYQHEPVIREVALLFERARGGTIVEHLLGVSDNDETRRWVKEYFLSVEDEELDRWLHAVASGVAIEPLKCLWKRDDWHDESLRSIVTAWNYFERVRRQPLGVLLPVVLLGTEFGHLLTDASKFEQRFPDVSPADLADAQVQRETLLRRLERHWEDLTKELGGKSLDIRQCLVNEPAKAVALLLEFEEEPDALQMSVGLPPLLKIELSVTQKRLSLQALRQSEIKQALDWLRTLLVRQKIPSWPWFGELPTEWNTARLCDVWNKLRDRIPNPKDNVSDPASSEFLQILATIRVIVSAIEDRLCLQLLDEIEDRASAVEALCQQTLSNDPEE